MADNVYNLKFTLSNGDVIDAGQITAPQGPKGDKGDSADIPYSASTPFMDGVGSVGSANTVARGDHRHPTDTSRQEKLVSGTNIKTINGQSVLGSGDIPISGGTIDADTLNGLLSGSNGIDIAKNTSGDKVEVKLSNNGFTIGDTAGTLSDQTITINPQSGEGAYISVNYHGSVGTKITPYDIRITDPGGDVSYGLTSSNVKTILGQSIYGSGHIDLYKHNLHIFDQIALAKTEMYCQIISSSNLNIDSLTDLQAILANNEKVCAFGVVRVRSDASRTACGISKDNVYALDEIGKIYTVSWKLVTDYSSLLTFEDTVTPV